MNELRTSNHSQMLIPSIPNPKGVNEGLPVEFGQLLIFFAEVAAISTN
ncbi:MAG TPA: hypothetical protein V6C91_01425 [Coleofasciculaceae cyanobacterium]